MAKSVDRTLGPHEAEARRQQSKTTRLQELSDLRVLMNTVEGRRFLYRVLEKAHCSQTIFSSDALTLAHNAGFQDCGLFIQSEMQEVSIPLYFRMLKEGLENRDFASEVVAEIANQLKDEAASRGDDVDS